jgi:hypothetical protein
MNLSTIKQSWQEVDEIILQETGELVTSLDKVIGSERLLSIAHSFGRPVFFDYKISLDGGTTFYPPFEVPHINSHDHLRMFADDQFLYFDYYNNGGGTATQVTWRYKIYVIEAKAK